MQRRQLIVAILAVLIGFFASHLAMQLPAQQAGVLGGLKRCVGVTSSILRSQNPVVTRLYRAFDDGSVETYDDGAPGAKWTPLSK